MLVNYQIPAKKFKYDFNAQHMRITARHPAVKDNLHLFQIHVTKYLCKTNLKGGREETKQKSVDQTK